MDKEQLYRSPLVYQRADPYVYLHTDGYYYFTGSVPQYDCIELRRAKSLNELLTANSHIIWRRHINGPMGSHIWAPELHRINDKWYVYFAAGGSEDVWNIRMYALECTDSDPILGEWRELGEIKTCAGEHSFALDMTHFEHRGRHYAIWAQKLSEEDGSCLYMAEMKGPSELKGKQMLLSCPEYDWECLGFKVNEGPAVLKRNGRIFVTYSASDTSWRYCMGMLWADNSSDLLDPASWNKSDKPVFMTCEENSQYGPGHNSFTTDGGRDVIIYHSRNYKEINGDPLHDPNRHARAKVFDYDENGFPVFGEPVPDNL